MGFLKRMIKKGISEGIENAIGKAVETAVAPKAQQFADKLADKIDDAAENANESIRSVKNAENETGTGWKSAFANLEKSLTNYATEASKNVKVCSNCGQPTSADKKFCPGCGVKLPEETLAQGAVCPNCGTQNDLGTKFCQECGTKLPHAVQEEQRALEKDAQVMEEWNVHLTNYPKWNCGGSQFVIEDMDGYWMFTATFTSSDEAQEAVKKYRILLQENDFKTAGQYPSVYHLYKMIDETCYHVDTEHCFDGDGDSPCIYFNVSEPQGGFDYVKPEPKKQVDLKDFFKF